MLITGFIILVTWSSAVLVVASHHGRVLRRAHRAAIASAILGVLLVLPALLIGTYGLPTS